ncbi:hypothetical protein KI809_18385 [Geobacter pelophilus]|uniref:Uncharacterized protein n=1 Tax=Geoanaerobacter pelophilus TaxID=60036 RepID=A0AAW4L5V2_9BACT|nr:hypothetical protein [Geoanaerobacter pelophilus]MBT0666283.1 hypothetical protein [Geoanaerobacter pelophilus]
MTYDICFLVESENRVIHASLHDGLLYFRPEDVAAGIKPDAVLRDMTSEKVYKVDSLIAVVSAA